MKAKSRGFTLIELLIVVGIIAILAAIAYPSYQNYVMRARRADGKELAMRIAAAEERYFTNLNKYTDTLADLGISGTSEKGFYTAAVELGAADQTFLVKMSPEPIQASDSCGMLTINNTGAKQAPDDTGVNGKCW